MKRNTLTDQIKLIVNPMLKDKLLKANSIKDLWIDINTLSTAQKLDILEAAQDITDPLVKRLQYLIDREIYCQFRRVQRLKKFLKAQNVNASVNEYDSRNCA